MKAITWMGVAPIVLSLSALVATPLLAQQSASVSLGEAADYNLLVFGDFRAEASSSTGPLAAEGDMVLNHHGLATGLAPGSAAVAAVAGGDFSFDVGKVHGGHVLVGQNASIGGEVRYGLEEEQLLLEQVDSPIDFDRIETQLLEQSRAISELDANGEVELRYGGLHLTGDCASPLQVFQLDGAELLDAHTFEVTCIPEGANIVFNVSGETTGMGFMSLESLRPYRARTLYNFYEATSLSFRNIAIHGSVLAPRAQVDNPTGDLHGTLVARSWDGPMFLNFVRFQGYREGTRQCEGPVDG